MNKQPNQVQDFVFELTEYVSAVAIASFGTPFLGPLAWVPLGALAVKQLSSQKSPPKQDPS